MQRLDTRGFAALISGGQPDTARGIHGGGRDIEYDLSGLTITIAAADGSRAGTLTWDQAATWLDAGSPRPAST